MKTKAAGKSGAGVEEKAGEGQTPEAGTGTGVAADGGDLIDMAEAIALLKTSRPTFYRWLRSGRVKGMKLGRQWRFYRRDIEDFLRGKGPRIELPTDITPLVEELDGKLNQLGKSRLAVEASSELERAVNLVIALAFAMRASDIHFTAHMALGASQPRGLLRFRIDGALHAVAEIDHRLMAPIVEEWKRRAACNVHERHLPQDGRISSFALPGEDARPLDLRLCFLPHSLGEALTVRILRQDAASFKLEKLPYSAENLERIRRALKIPWGIIFCAGPSGSGKTTTLYSLLNEVSSPEKKIMCVEDPVEYMLPWATQVQVARPGGMDMASAMRSILRSDPDVILLGEIRDRESLMVAIHAALTGHLVLSTLHTDDAAGALKRLVDMGIDPFLASDSTRLVIAQRLIRRLCPNCAKSAKPTSEDRKQAVELARRGGLEFERIPAAFKAPVGCKSCAMTGYRGRTLIAETLEVTPEIGRAVRVGATVDQLRELAVKQGMRTIGGDGIGRVADGETSLREVLRVYPL